MIQRDPFAINVPASSFPSAVSGSPPSPSSTSIGPPSPSSTSSVSPRSFREKIVTHSLELASSAKIHQSALNVFMDPDQVQDVELLTTYGYEGALAQGRLAQGAVTEREQWEAAKLIYGSCGPTARTVMSSFCGPARGEAIMEEHAAAGKAIRDGQSITQCPNSGADLADLYHALKDTLRPTVTVITLGGSHIYILETLPRTNLNQPLEGVILNSCFNSYNLTYWMSHHEGKALVNVEAHLKQIDELVHEPDGLERMEKFNQIFQPEGIDDIYLESIMGGSTLPDATTVWTTTTFSRQEVSDHIIELIARHNIGP